MTDVTNMVLRIGLVVVAPLFAMLCGKVSAQDDANTLTPAELLERFQLYTGCEPMPLFVEAVPDENDIGLTRERVQTLVESRLRAARLFTDEGLRSYLHVTVGVFRPAWAIGITFRKPVLDHASGLHHSADTWRSSSFGTHGGDSDYIMQRLSEEIDAFILKYLRVNEEDCNAR